MPPISPLSPPIQYSPISTDSCQTSIPKNQPKVNEEISTDSPTFYDNELSDIEYSNCWQKQLEIKQVALLDKEEVLSKHPGIGAATFLAINKILSDLEIPKTTKAYNNLLDFAEIVGHKENSGKEISKNPCYSGLYQFAKQTFNNAANKLKDIYTQSNTKISEKLNKAKNANPLSKDEQTAVFLVNIFENDKLLTNEDDYPNQQKISPHLKQIIEADTLTSKQVAETWAKNHQCNQNQISEKTVNKFTKIMAEVNNYKQKRLAEVNIQANSIQENQQS